MQNSSIFNGISVKQDLLDYLRGFNVISLSCMDTRYIFSRCNKAEKLPLNLSSCCPLSFDVLCCLLFFAWPNQRNKDFSMLYNQYIAELSVQCPSHPPLSVKQHRYSAHKVVLCLSSASNDGNITVKSMESSCTF